MIKMMVAMTMAMNDGGDDPLVMVMTMVMGMITVMVVGDDFNYSGDYLWSQWFVMVVVMMIVISGLLFHLFIYSCI